MRLDLVPKRVASTAGVARQRYDLLPTSLQRADQGPANRAGGSCDDDAHGPKVAGCERFVFYDQISSNTAWSNGTSQHSAIRPSTTRNTPTVSHETSCPSRNPRPPASCTTRPAIIAAPWTVTRNVESVIRRRVSRYESTASMPWCSPAIALPPGTCQTTSSPNTSRSDSGGAEPAYTRACASWKRRTMETGSAAPAADPKSTDAKAEYRAPPGPSCDRDSVTREHRTANPPGGGGNETARTRASRS